jgi:hypothetical protein
MSLIHGSRGLIYFVHQFKPKFREPALLDDPEMLAAVTLLNRQVTGLAPVLNSPTITDAATVSSENAAVPVAIMVKRHENATYLFAVGMRNSTTTATFAQRIYRRKDRGSPWRKANVDRPKWRFQRRIQPLGRASLPSASIAPFPFATFACGFAALRVSWF